MRPDPNATTQSAPGSGQMVADQSQSNGSPLNSFQMDTNTLTPQALSRPGWTKDLLRVWSKKIGTQPALADGFDPFTDFNHARFRRGWIPAMQRDPHVMYGIWILRGPIISKAKYEVVSDSPEVQEYVQNAIERYWARGISEALTAMEWGFNGNEVIYEWNDDSQTVDYKSVKFFHPYDTLPVTKQGYLLGMKVRKRQGYFNAAFGGWDNLTTDDDDDTESVEDKKHLFVPVSKALWSVHDRRYHRWYGRSRYEGAFIPWYEFWQPKGFRNIRHLAMYKYSFTGGVIMYPPGSSQDADTGEEVPNSLLAEQYLDLIEAGAGIALPSTFAESGGWEYLPPQAMQIPEGLFTYGDQLRDEKWEGLGVPPEIAKQEQTGSFAGRRVPQQAFYSFLQEIANDLMQDFEEQVLRPLVKLNFGSKARFKIKPISILQTLQEEEMGAVTGHLPGDEEDPFYNGEEEPELDEDGNPIEEDSSSQEKPLSNGRIEDRDSNAFNKQEKGFAKKKK